MPLLMNFSATPVALRPNQMTPTAGRMKGVIAVSFIPMVTSLIFPVFFQAIGSAFKSSALTILRTIVLFVPLGWVLAHFGLESFWFTFPITEVITTAVGFIMYRKSRFGRMLSNGYTI